MASAGLRILVIDDDTMVSDSLAALLQAHGHTVTLAEDGGQALEYIGAHPFDLVITDIIMSGTDGIEAIQVIRRQFPSMSIIAMSGGGCGFRPGYLETAHTLGADETLAKPFEEGILLETIERAMARH
ncbi:MAG TPA: response regulator [Rhizomicrobium sp.]|nr:response regulator [Rhizomicrobium sp.]